MDYLARQYENGVLAHKHNCKEDSICTIMRNIDICESQVKNRQAFVEHLHQKVIEFHIIDSSAEQFTLHISYITFDFHSIICSWKYPMSSISSSIGLYYYIQ